jgi:hypothetical protein
LFGDQALTRSIFFFWFYRLISFCVLLVVGVTAVSALRQRKGSAHQATVSHASADSVGWRSLFVSVGGFRSDNPFFFKFLRLIQP